MFCPFQFRKIIVLDKEDEETFGFEIQVRIFSGSLVVLHSISTLGLTSSIHPVNETGTQGHNICYLDIIYWTCHPNHAVSIICWNSAQHSFLILILL